LREHPEAREKLTHAVVEEIIAAAAAAGYEFSAKDLRKAIGEEPIQNEARRNWNT
jgi:hypothetical protein